MALSLLFRVLNINMLQWDDGDYTGVLRWSNAVMISMPWSSSIVCENEFDM